MLLQPLSRHDDRPPREATGAHEHPGCVKAPPRGAMSRQADRDAEEGRAQRPGSCTVDEKRDRDGRSRHQEGRQRGIAAARTARSPFKLRKTARRNRHHLGQEALDLVASQEREQGLGGGGLSRIPRGFHPQRSEAERLAQDAFEHGDGLDPGERHTGFAASEEPAPDVQLITAAGGGETGERDDRTGDRQEPRRREQHHRGKHHLARCVGDEVRGPDGGAEQVVESLARSGQDREDDAQLPGGGGGHEQPAGAESPRRVGLGPWIRSASDRFA